MAIQATIITIQGVQLDKAYINLGTPQIIKTKVDGVNVYSLGANACVYASKEAYETGLIPVEGFSVTCKLDLADNVLAQAYTALKENPRLQNITEA